MTSQKPTSQFTQGKLMFSPEDSLANHTHKQESDLGKPMKDISFRKCYEQLKRSNRDTSWARMFVDSLVGGGDWYSTRCAMTWKGKAMQYNRFLFLLQVSAHRTKDKEFGLLLTPTTKEDPVNLEKFKKRMEKYPNGTTMPNLATQVMGMLPTPKALEAPSASWENRKKDSKFKPGVTLTDLMIWGMLPTPTTRDANGIENSPSQKGKFRLAADLGDGTTSQLNPHFVGEMMGFPENWTESPFLNGEMSQSKDSETL